MASRVNAVDAPFCFEHSPRAESTHDARVSRKRISDENTSRFCPGHELVSLAIPFVLLLALCLFEVSTSESLLADKWHVIASPKTAVLKLREVDQRNDIVQQATRLSQGVGFDGQRLVKTAWAVHEQLTVIRTQLRDGRIGEQPWSTAQGLAALQTLGELEDSIRGVWAALGESASAMLPTAADLVWEEVDDVAELWLARDGIGTILLETVREGRLFALTLPLSQDDVRVAVARAPALLTRLESFATLIAEAAGDAAAQFQLGMYWSEVGLAKQGAPLFFNTVRTSRRWARDERGIKVPESIANAERWLSLSVDSSAAIEESERVAARALRLHLHAQFLASMELDHVAAAEWRYRAAAQLTTSPKLAARSLAWLSHMLVRSGRHAEAVEVAGEALTYAADPLALYTQATLRRSLGLFREAAEVETAMEHLEAVAGYLPSTHLEKKRQDAHAELKLWRESTNGGLSSCFAHGDAARALICIFCKALMG